MYYEDSGWNIKKNLLALDIAVICGNVRRPMRTHLTCSLASLVGSSDVQDIGAWKTLRYDNSDNVLFSFASLHTSTMNDELPRLCILLDVIKTRTKVKYAC